MLWGRNDDLSGMQCRRATVDYVEECLQKVENESVIYLESLTSVEYSGLLGQ